jgi:hypothetical protein
VSIVDRLPRRVAKTRPDAATQHDVQELIFLAPYLGERNPSEVSGVVRHMRNLIPDPPPFGGLDADEHGPSCAPNSEPRAQRRSCSVVAHARHTISDARERVAYSRLRIAESRHRIA